MTPARLQDIFAAKQARRSRLARLPIDEKVDLIEQLHQLAHTMIEARESIHKPVVGLEEAATGASLRRYFREGVAV
jgi:hypothetical protein